MERKLFAIEFVYLRVLRRNGSDPEQLSHQRKNRSGSAAEK
jgi:hypothetical protein